MKHYKGFVLIVLLTGLLVGLSSQGLVEAKHRVLLVPGYLNSAGLGPPVPYASWRMDAESTLTNVNFVVFMSSPTTGGNETGYSPLGTLTGANLVGTQAGNLAGSTDGKSRVFDRSDDKLTFTTTCTCTLAETSTWTLIVRVKNLGALTATASYPVMFHDGTGTDFVQLYHAAAYGDGFEVKRNGVALLEAKPTNNVSTSDDVIMAWWSDGTYVRAGWMVVGTGSGAAGQPTKWSDFPSTQRVSATVDGTLRTNIGGTYQGIDSFTTKCGGQFYFLLMARTCLIDNSN